MKFSVAKEKDTVIIKPEGRLDSMTAPTFEQDMDIYLKEPEGNLLFDCIELDYISSAGLRVVLNLAKAYRAAAWKFAACNMQDHVREVFEISGFDSFITIYESVGEFLESSS